MKRILILAALAAASQTVIAEPAPLSCKMRILLSTSMAMNRDVGRSRSDALKSLKSTDEFTKKEIKYFLDLVYERAKNKTPDEISNIAARECQ